MKKECEVHMMVCSLIVILKGPGWNGLYNRQVQLCIYRREEDNALEEGIDHRRRAKTATRTMNGTYVNRDTTAMIRHRRLQDFASCST